MSIEQLNKLKWPAVILILAVIFSIVYLMAIGIIEPRVGVEILGGLVMFVTGVGAGRKLPNNTGK